MRRKIKMINADIMKRLQALREQRAKQALINVQHLYNLGFPIENYVQLGTITPEQYKQITNKDYVVPTTVA